MQGQTKTGQKSSQKKPATRRLLPGLAVRDGMVRHPFDLEFGVRTSGLVAGRNLKTGHQSDRHATAYYAVAPSVFRSLLVRWRRLKPLLPLDSYNFIDLGAGMGRALLLAAEFPFRAVVGVEMHPALARIGRKNIGLWRAAERARAPMRMVECDAAEFPLPTGPCAVFLFNPFGAPVLRRMLRSWNCQLAGREGQLDILYVNNEQDRVLAAEPGFVRLFSGAVRRSPADTAADRNILTSQPDAEYAATAWEDCSIYRWMGKTVNAFSELR